MAQPTANTANVRAYLKENYTVNECQLDLVMNHEVAKREIAEARRMSSFAYYPAQHIAQFFQLDDAPWAQE